ncbi:MAG TPA: tRNA uridine-5-carboxymethylaminomethyl(34) synthesis GTPase MnmE [Ktedonobacterales bacterium]
MGNLSADYLNRSDTAETSDTADTIETIAAIATPPGIGGIGIVRISGPDAFAVGRRIFHSSTQGDELPPSHLLTYGHVVDAGSGETIDEVLAVFMRAPRTYTREDVVEIHAHGGPLVLQRILELTFAAGARAARAGEMTLRAFLNGRLDLAQAEAVMSLINAESDAGRRLALRQLQGDLSTRVQRTRADVLAALVRIEASIDFPEEEVPPPNPGELGGFIDEARAQIGELLAGANRGRLMREGLRVALIGRPNVGKSSLLNALLRTERAIVTPIPGTTRDTVEERATIGGIVLHLVDTAGLTPTDDPVERVGVERSRAAARTADLIIFVLDGSAPLTDLDGQAAEELRAVQAGAQTEAAGVTPLVLAINKADLPAVVGDDEAQVLWPEAALVHTSTVTPDGITRLEQAITRMALGGQAVAGDVLVSSARHRDALRRAGEHLAAAATTLADGLPLDFVSVDLRGSLESLGEITGETATGDLLDRIFAEFCIGK